MTNYRIIDDGAENAVSIGDEWTPRLVGNVFCSPACGGDCKKADFDNSTEAARMLAAQLGRGWIPRVWENLGWHFEVNKGVATVSLERCGKYSACIEFSIIDQRIDKVSALDADPRIAMQRVIDVMNEKVSLLKRALMSASIEPLEIDYA
jgi:hypothetical protein